MQPIKENIEILLASITFLFLFFNKMLFTNRYNNTDNTRINDHSFFPKPIKHDNIIAKKYDKYLFILLNCRNIKNNANKPKLNIPTVVSTCKSVVVIIEIGEIDKTSRDKLI